MTVAQVFGQQGLNRQPSYQQQLYTAPPPYVSNRDCEIYQRYPLPYQPAQPLALNAFVENNALIDEAHYRQQQFACSPTQPVWHSPVTEHQMMGRRWDASAAAAAANVAMHQQMQQQHQQQQQWEQVSLPQFDQDNAPSVLLGLVQATPPRSPPSEAEAPPSCRGRGENISESSLVVQNTFLNIPKTRSPSLEPFYKERLVRSSPPSGPSSGTQTPNLIMSDARNPRIPNWLRRDQFPQGRNGIEPGFAAMVAAARLTKEFSCNDNAQMRPNEVPGRAYPEWLRRDEAHQTVMDDSTLGSDELPSIGSQLHSLGTCKPCAFVLKGGCGNGQECPFCHLCEPGEKKRRKKERLMIRREARQEARKQRQLATAGWN